MKSISSTTRFKSKSTMAANNINTATADKYTDCSKCGKSFATDKMFIGPSGDDTTKYNNFFCVRCAPVEIFVSQCDWQQNEEDDDRDSLLEELMALTSGSINRGANRSEGGEGWESD